MKYSAINIGPIVSTLGMARKPRELWAASYLFSYLMKCIYEVAEKEGVEIISPAKPDVETKRVGIYPDRLYVKGTLDAEKVLESALELFYIDFFGKGNNPDISFFNLMATSCEAAKESLAIAELNQQLDVMELCNFAKEGKVIQTIYDIISQKGNYPFSTELESIAKCQKNANPQDVKEKMHHRYFCVVQADGDNIGKTISHKDLNNGDIKKISKSLVKFGQQAIQIIEDFGGVPIYAGGDDLLFLAPVIGKNGTNIFTLLDIIEEKAFKDVHDVVSELRLKDKDKNDIEASLSFGISINYHKYPLYEALECARNLLFNKAKNTVNKNAIAWRLRKHSGGTFEAAYSKKDNKIHEQFKALINATTDKDTVSCVAHKIRQEGALVNIVLESNEPERLNALFEKVLEFDNDKEGYFNAVKNIMPTLYQLYIKEQENRGYRKGLCQCFILSVTYC